jgi:hypothetical protein
MRKFAAVTTFNKNGLDLYGQNLIDSFCKNMPLEVDLYIYAENCDPIIPNDNNRKIKIIKTERLKELTEFKEKYSLNSKNIVGNFKDFLFKHKHYKLKKKLQKLSTKSYIWNVVRFSHKVYAFLDAAKITDADVLMWTDGDMFVHNQVPMSFLDHLMPEDRLNCYLGRENMHTETGWYSVNLRYPQVTEFLNEYQRMYDDAENGILQLEGWTDCHAYDATMQWHQKKFNSVNKNLNEGPEADNNHPLINSELGQYFDHLKGNRKDLGKSVKEDLKVKRDGDYWSVVKEQNLPSANL